MNTHYAALGSSIEGTIIKSFDGSMLGPVTDELLKVSLSDRRMHKVIGAKKLDSLQHSLPP